MSAWKDFLTTAVFDVYSNVQLAEIDAEGNVTCYTLDSNGERKEITTGISQDDINARAKLLELRNERNRKLIETDYLALSDNTMTDAMTTYRQELRDITNTYSDLDSVVWPEKP